MRARVWPLACATIAVMASGLPGCAAPAVIETVEPAPPALAVTPPPAVPQPVAEADLRRLAELLRLQDRRELDLPTVARAASSPDPRIRAAAALHLGRLRDLRGLSLLRELIADTDTAVAATAAFAFGQLADSSAVPLLEWAIAERGSLSVAREAVLALGKLPTSVAADLLRRVASDTATARETRAAAFLASARHPAPLGAAEAVAASAAPDPQIRRAAAYLLGRRPVAAAAPALLRLIRDPEPLVRAHALRGLSTALLDSAGLSADSAVPAIAMFTRDPDYLVRINALRALGRFGPAAVDLLTPHLGSPRPHDVLTALESLGRIGPPAAPALPRLAGLLGADSAHVAHRAAALDAILSIDTVAALRQAEMLPPPTPWRVRAAAARVAGTAGPPELLRRSLNDPDERIAAAAMEALAASPPARLERVRRLLLEIVAARDPLVRAPALRGLGRLADPATLPVLLDAFERARRDTIPDAALAAVEALGALREAGYRPDRAFRARFPAPEDPLVAAAVRRAFPADELGAWAESPPYDPSVSTGESLELARTAIGPSARPIAVLDTERGEIALRLLPAVAPMTVANFVQLARRGYFDGQEWPRVVPAFVVQGGDPRGDTSGGPGYTIRDEINRRPYESGTVGMALAGPDTGGSQFFITHSPQPHLDGTYTVFGELLAGEHVLRRLLPGDRIESVRIEQTAAELDRGRID